MHRPLRLASAEPATVSVSDACNARVTKALALVRAVRLAPASVSEVAR
ncbi:hypothetical protein [Streptomyces sp. NPDC087538]